MTPVLKVKAGVRWEGIQPPIGKVLDAAPEAFARFGYDCWLTCLVEPRGSGLHPKGLAGDFDSSSNIPEPVGKSIAETLRVMVGKGYDALWHRVKRKDDTYGAWHLHTEYDPK